MKYFYNLIQFVSRIRYKNTKSFDDVTEIQEGCHILEHKVNAGEGDSGSRHPAGVCALLLGSLTSH